ncbi:hypothetical protein C8J56DRAFT_1042455 [Mycena floridula]|nr:hypothetical protein C8J56DRAFT_1042455 [Mycena floridula]
MSFWFALWVVILPFFESRAADDASFKAVQELQIKSQFRDADLGFSRHWDECILIWSRLLWKADGTASSRQTSGLTKSFTSWPC